MFEGTKAEQKAKQADHAREVMRGYRGRVFYTRTEFGRGETDHVRIYVATKRDEISDITYYVARANDLRMSDRGIPFGGGGYSKGLEAADYAYQAAHGKPLNQKFWRELH